MICDIEPGFSTNKESVVKKGETNSLIKRLKSKRKRKIALLNVHNQSNVNASPEFWRGLIMELVKTHNCTCVVNHTMLSIKDTQKRIDNMLPISRFICLTPKDLIASMNSVDLIIGVAGGAMEIAHCYTETACMTFASHFHQWPAQLKIEGVLISRHRQEHQINPLLLDHPKNSRKNKKSRFYYLEEGARYNKEDCTPIIKELID